MSTGMSIALVGPSGTRWPVHGDDRAPGITLAEGGVDGLIDSPIETEWIDDTEMGSVFAGERYLPRDLKLGFFISDELAGTPIAGRLESDFRTEFSTRPDPWDPSPQSTKVEVVSDLSGLRWLSDTVLKETPEMKTERDPYTHRLYDLTYHLRAGMPLWDSGKEVTVFEGTTASKSGTITVSNPTDMPMRHTWVIAGVGATVTLPDPSWLGPKTEREPGGDYPSRAVALPQITAGDQGVRVTRERRKLHAQTFTGSNFLVRMLGNWIRFDIPPYTPPTELPVSYTGATAGCRIECHQPRLWSRPLGLELM